VAATTTPLQGQHNKQDDWQCGQLAAAPASNLAAALQGDKK
jgi:hypothetical protein